MSLGNRIAVATLRSPVHRILSESLLLLRYTGRRSGREYELPLQYLEDGGKLNIWAGNAATKTWWRNFADPDVVTVRLRGRDVVAKASLVEAVDRRAEVLRAYLTRFPYTTPSGRPKFVGRRWQPTDAELSEVAASIVVVTLDAT
jgi:deazaflavin-dependent oxidoreductase (nitroreductase family)